MIEKGNMQPEWNLFVGSLSTVLHNSLYDVNIEKIKNKFVFKGQWKVSEKE